MPRHGRGVHNTIFSSTVGCFLGESYVLSVTQQLSATQQSTLSKKGK